MTYSRDFLTTANQSFQIAPLLPGVPVLDQDINVMQNAQFEQMRESLKARVPSGWLDKIESEPIEQAAHNTSTTNCLYTMSGKDVLFICGNPRLVIDGMPVVLAHCAGGSTEAGDLAAPHSAVQMAALPTSTFQPANGVTSRKGTRVDMVMLEVWRKEITAPASTSAADRRLAGLKDDGTFFPFGNTQPMTVLGTLANDMIDPAVAGETSRRIQIQYRLRVVEDVNPHGSAHPMVAQNVAAWPSHKRTSADGVAASAYNFAASTSDAGIFMAGDGSSGAKAALNSFDGYIYAVPVAIVGRRNSSAWTMENLNGSTGRIDDKTGNVHWHDVVDFRTNVKIDNNWDYKAIYEENLNKILECNLRTTFEEWMMNSDGDAEFNAAGVIGTKLLRAEGLAGISAPVNNAFQQTWQLQHNKTTQNGVSTALEGIRNYFSDVGGDQVAVGMIPAMNSDTVNPNKLFSYNSSTKTITLNATDLESNNGTHTPRTKISTRKPHLKWGTAMNTLGLTNVDVAGTWTGLGGDSASFAISNETNCAMWLSDGASVEIGDVYQTSNGVNLTCNGKITNTLHTPGYRSFSFSGDTLPYTGSVLTKISGVGPVAVTPSIGMYAACFLKSSSVLTGVKAGDQYQNGTTTINISSVQNSYTVAINYVGGSLQQPPNSTWTRVTGNGVSSFISDFTSPTYDGIAKLEGGYISTGFGSNVMPTNAPIHVNAYLTFQPGSGFMNRIPHQNNNSFIGCHFNVNGTQVLPNGGKGFIPFGSTVDPVNDGNLPVDSHSRTSNLMGFVLKHPVMNENTHPLGYNSHYSHIPRVIKDGSTYKMWFSGYNGVNYRILYSTSTDGITWSTPVLAMDIGTEPNGYNSKHSMASSVIKDGSTYKMWFWGTAVSDDIHRILYSTSTDGITWSTPVLAMDIGTEPNGYNSNFSYDPCVIKDGSTYKMWFAGYNGSNARILYSTSTDGITWSTPVIAVNVAAGILISDPIVPNVIKEANTYKMFFGSYTPDGPGGYYRTFYATSSDGISWSNPTLFLDVNTTAGNLTQSLSTSVIKDGSTYKVWFAGTTGVYRINHAVLTMTDSANTGSSTTGVYPTAGSLNCAPPANSQVVVFYEAVADQMDRGNPQTEFIPAMLKYIPTFGIVTTAGTGSTYRSNTFKSPYRDFYANCIPQATNYILSSERLAPVDSNYAAHYASNENVTETLQTVPLDTRRGGYTWGGQPEYFTSLLYNMMGRYAALIHGQVRTYASGVYTQAWYPSRYLSALGVYNVIDLFRFNNRAYVAHTSSLIELMYGRNLQMFQVLHYSDTATQHIKFTHLLGRPILK